MAADSFIFKKNQITRQLSPSLPNQALGYLQQGLVFTFSLCAPAPHCWSYFTKPDGAYFSAAVTAVDR